MSELVEVHGTFQRADDEPVGGLITFIPMVAAVQDMIDPAATITLGPVQAQLDANGTFSVQVFASDSAGWRMAEPLPYTVLIAVDGYKVSFNAHINLPGPWDVADLIPFEGPPPVPGGGGGSGSGGTSIISGVGPPTAAVGVTGNYYVDHDGNTMYGPKSATAISPPPQTLFTDQLPVSEQDMGEPGVVGQSIQFSRDGQITALRYYRGETTLPEITSTTLHLFREDAEIATAFTNIESASGWQSAVLDTPVDVVMGEVLRIMCDFTSGQMVVMESDPKLEEFYYYYQMAPIANKYMRSVMAYIGYYPDPEDVNSLVVEPFPLPLFVDAIFTAEPTRWPVAVSSTYSVVQAPPEGGDVGGGLEVHGDLEIDGGGIQLYRYEQNDLEPDFGSVIEFAVDAPYFESAQVHMRGVVSSAEANTTFELNARADPGYASWDLLASKETIEIEENRDAASTRATTFTSSGLMITSEGLQMGGTAIWMFSETPIELQGPAYDPVRIRGVANPEEPNDAVNKAYVDAIVKGWTHPFQWKVNTAATDPAHGWMKANVLAATDYTELYISLYDEDGKAVIGLADLKSGDVLHIYEAGQIGTWNAYQLTGDPVLQGDPVEWLTLPIVYTESGPSLLTPTGNAHLVVVYGSGNTAGGGGTGFTRQTALLTTASLAPGAVETGTITLAPGYRIYGVAVDWPCRLRLYCDQYKRDDDTSRPLGTYPPDNSGVMLEIVPHVGIDGHILSPLVDGFVNSGDPDDAEVPYTITNLDTVPRAIECSIAYLRTE
jgi:Domain of unknown function (DUF4082)